jgi:hypothetical protein
MEGKKRFRGHTQGEVLRAATIMVMFCAAPAKALPRAKHRIEMRMTGRRPKTSARAPESGSMAVLESVYAEPTQEKLSPPLRSLVMVGSAVPTAVRSRALRNTDATRAVKVSQNALPFLGFVPTGDGGA